MTRVLHLNPTIIDPDMMPVEEPSYEEVDNPDDWVSESDED